MRMAWRSSEVTLASQARRLSVLLAPLLLGMFGDFDLEEAERQLLALQSGEWLVEEESGWQRLEQTVAQQLLMAMYCGEMMVEYSAEATK